jgi:hypothetical protein
MVVVVHQCLSQSLDFGRKSECDGEGMTQHAGEVRTLRALSSLRNAKNRTKAAY